MKACIIVNCVNERYHPAPLVAALMPGGRDLGRYRTAGHHTEGFATLDEAVADIEAKGWEKTFVLCEWDGEGVPAMTVFA